MKDKVSRRDFLKITLLGIGAGFITACKQVFKPAINTIATLTATPSKTNTLLPSETKTSTSTPTQTPTPTEIPCFHLLSPENGAKLPTVGRVTFSWEAMQGATIYKLEIIFPSMQSVFFETIDRNRDQYIEAFSMGGTYQWKVTAFNANGEVICSAESFTFEKPEYNPPSQNQNNSGGDDGGSNGDDGGNTVGGPVVGTVVGN